MKRRSTSDWEQLINEQLQSGLSAAAFCRERNISPKYFSLRKSRLKMQNSGFVKATISKRSTAGITLQARGVIMNLPSETSPQWAAQFVRELSS